MTRPSVLWAAVGAAALVLVGCSSGSTDSPDATTSSAQSSTSAPASTTQMPLDMTRFGVLPPVPAALAQTTTCSYPESSPAVKENVPPATTEVPTEGIVDVAVATNQGPIGVTLDRTEAPCTVNSFTSLASQGYFDDTPCHRLTTSAGLEVLQCGDPSGTGSRGPGYEYANEYPTTAFAPEDPALSMPVVYPRGTVAMANAGPGTNGSQFFLVYADSVLPPQYTVFGTISEEGLATLDSIAEAGVSGGASDGAPIDDVILETVTA